MSSIRSTQSQTKYSLIFRTILIWLLIWQCRPSKTNFATAPLAICKFITHSLTCLLIGWYGICSQQVLSCSASALSNESWDNTAHHTASKAPLFLAGIRPRWPWLLTHISRWEATAKMKLRVHWSELRVIAAAITLIWRDKLLFRPTLAGVKT